MAQDAVVRLKQGEEEEFIEFLLNNRAHAHDLHFDCMHNDACEWARPEPDNYPPELEPFDLDHVPLELHPLAWWLLVLPIPLLLGLVAWVLYLGLHKRRYADAKRVLATWINVPNLNILISVTGFVLGLAVVIYLLISLEGDREGSWLWTATGTGVAVLAAMGTWVFWGLQPEALPELRQDERWVVVPDLRMPKPKPKPGPKARPPQPVLPSDGAADSPREDSAWWKLNDS